MRRLVLSAAAPAAVLLALSPVAARASRTDIAPPGTASATALRAGEVVGVSNTGATAANDTATAEASVLEVGGQPVLGLGGTLPRTGAALASLGAMALLAVIAGPLLRLATRRQARMVA